MKSWAKREAAVPEPEPNKAPQRRLQRPPRENFVSKVYWDKRHSLNEDC